MVAWILYGLLNEHMNLLASEVELNPDHLWIKSFMIMFVMRLCISCGVYDVDYSVVCTMNAGI